MPLMHIRLPEEVVEAIENVMEGANRTDKVKNFICSNIIGRETLELEKDKCLAKIKYIDQALKDNPFYGKEIFSEEEKTFLEETLDILGKPQFKKSPLFFTARKNMYNEKFSKAITTKEFELLVYRFKEKLTAK